MHILVVNHEFPPIGGGASKVSYELSKAIVNSGHTVTVLTSRMQRLPSFEIVDGIRVHRVWSWRKGIHEGGIRGSWTFLAAALQRLRHILGAEQVDLVHYFFGVPSGLLSFYTHSIRKVPYVVGLRGSDVPFYDRENRRLQLLHRFLLPLTQRIWRNASQVLSVSGGLRDLAVQVLPGLDVRVIYNGVDIVEDADERRTSRLDGTTKIASVARLVPRKGINLLLQAVANLNEMKLELTVAGTGPSLEKLQLMAQDLGIADRVKFAGYCSPADLREIYIGADIFALPTLSDAFPNVVLEAMGAALPVVASRVGGIPEAVEDGRSGLLVEPGDVDSLTRSLRELASNRELRSRFGRNGQERVRDLFTWSRNSDQHVRVYESAIQSIRD